jgi:hypothetical protein
MACLSIMSSKYLKGNGNGKVKEKEKEKESEVEQLRNLRFIKDFRYMLSKSLHSIYIYFFHLLLCGSLTT